jgi:hypothetical protein
MNTSPVLSKVAAAGTVSLAKALPALPRIPSRKFFRQ